VASWVQGGAAGAQRSQQESPPSALDPPQDEAVPKLLARFRVNTTDTLAVYKAVGHACVCTRPFVCVCACMCACVHSFCAG